jgi:hypothetical protein
MDSPMATEPRLAEQPVCDFVLCLYILYIGLLIGKINAFLLSTIFASVSVLIDVTVRLSLELALVHYSMCSKWQHGMTLT